MAATTGVELSTQKVRKEQVLNLIRLLDMKKTPFLDRVSKGATPWNVINSWTVDQYAAPTSDGVLEGQDVSQFDDTALNREELEIYIQQWRRPWKVSQFAQNMAVYGLPQGEAAEAVRKSMVHITRDMEVTFLGDNETQKGTTSVPYKTRGLGKWIQTGAQTLFPVPSAYRPSDAQVVTNKTDVSEENLRKMLTAIFDSTGYSNAPLILMCGSAFRNAFTAMTLHPTPSSTANRTARDNRRVNITDKVVTDTIDTWIGDFNEVHVVSNNFIGWNNTTKQPNKDRAYVLDMENLEVGFLDYQISKELENRGGGRRGFIDAFGVLRVISPSPHGKFNGS